MRWKIAYDEQGRVRQLIDPASRTVTYRYTEAKDVRFTHVEQISADGQRVGRKFDTFGHLVEMTDGNVSQTYVYDAFGRLATVSRNKEWEIRYQYDLKDRMISLEVQRVGGGMHRVEYAYDYLGRLDKMTTPGGVVRYDYQTGAGKVTRTLPNDIKTIWQRDVNGQLQEIKHGRAHNETARGYELEPLASYSYAYRPDGLIGSIRETTEGRSLDKVYSYDKVRRLEKVEMTGGRSYAYSYDAMGNMLTSRGPDGDHQHSYDWLGRLQAVDGTPCQHDVAGNLTYVSVSGVARHFEYTKDNRLVGVDNGKVSYEYDGDGNLIARSAKSRRMAFVPDPMTDIWRPLLTVDADGKEQFYVWEGNRPLGLMEDGKATFFLQDHLGSVRCRVGTGGKLLGWTNYDPFGEPLGKLDERAIVAPSFCGLFWDETSQLTLTRCRGYFCGLHRFMQMDPKQRLASGLQQDLSPYGYCGDDPVNLVDLDGAEPVPFDWRSWMIELQMRMREMQDETRQRQQEMLWQQRESMDRMRNQVSGVAGRQLSGAIRFRDDLLHVEALAVGTQAASLGAFVSSFVPGIGSTIVGGVLNGVRDSLTDRLWGYGASRDFDKQQAAWDAVTNAKGKLEGLWGLGKNALHHLDVRSVTHDEFLHGGIHLRSTTPFKNQWEWYGPVTRTKIEGAEAFAKAHFESLSEKLRDEILKEVGKGAGRALVEFSLPRRDESMSSRPPSPVGGVYLGGAGKSLDGLGLLSGVELDPAGNLVLLAERGDIRVPPLRLDDVVTIFRSVYLDGEGPTVTIDPSEQDPEHSAMIIRHSKATERTYVGWVLYQADRLMKGYNLGHDNVTEQPIHSVVQGYEALLNNVYFGGGLTEKSEQSWERFWIVPAEARRFAPNRSALTLFDVPVKVRTQPMIMQAGKLHDDPNRPSSPGAATFTNWFARNYDGIADEQLLYPPKETGMTKPVPVFTELRRMFLITAIAEQLRAQGVPMPFWMRDYEVKLIDFEITTPSMRITKRNGRAIARIFGGVNSSPADTDVHTYKTTADLDQVPRERQTTARAALTRAAVLADALKVQMAGAAPLEIREIKAVDEPTAQAVALPGSSTRALAPCVLRETDLSLPLADGTILELTRSYNSFFNPHDLWGQGWTLDLPRLESMRIPIKREGSRVTFKKGYEVLTSLNSLHGRFERVAAVPALGGEMMVPDAADSPFFGLSDGKATFLTQPTKRLFLKDGDVWHFSDAGSLVAIEQKGKRTVFERNSEGRITAIVKMTGRYEVGRIVLLFDDEGRLTGATATPSRANVLASEAQSVSYHYDENTGALAKTTSVGQTITYAYQDSLLTMTTNEIQGEPVEVRRFHYNERAQLIAESKGDHRIDYQFAGDARGTSMTSAGDDKSTTRYDQAMRPVESLSSAGQQTKWTYGTGKAVVQETTTPGGLGLRIEQSADAATLLMKVEGKPEMITRYDQAGRPIALELDKQKLVEQNWSSDGSLESVSDNDAVTRVNYDSEGLQSMLTTQPARAATEDGRFMQSTLDAFGNATKVTDSTGLDLGLGYDDAGRITSMVQTRDGRRLGFNVKRDVVGRVIDLESSWGQEHHDYDAEGQITRSEFESDQQKAVVEYAGGHLQRITGFDGGNTDFVYDSTGELKSVKTPVIELSYGYTPNHLLDHVNAGTCKMAFDYDDQGRVTAMSYEKASKAGAAQ